MVGILTPSAPPATVSLDNALRPQSWGLREVVRPRKAFSIFGTTGQTAPVQLGIRYLLGRVFAFRRSARYSQALLTPGGVGPGVFVLLASHLRYIRFISRSSRSSGNSILLVSPPQCVAASLPKLSGQQAADRASLFSAWHFESKRTIHGSSLASYRSSDRGAPPQLLALSATKCLLSDNQFARERRVSDADAHSLVCLAHPLAGIICAA